MYTNQILGLQMQALQQSILNSIKIFNCNNKSEFTSWVQSVENAVKLCNLDTLSIELSKLQGPPLLTLKGHVGIHSQHSKFNTFHPQSLVLTDPTDRLQKAHHNH